MFSAAIYKNVYRPLRNVVSVRPWLYMPLRRALRPAGIIRPETELVIEGYPRSGNSFAEAAFTASQSRPRHLAHHSHAAAQVLAATTLNIPCLVVFRDPFDVGRSLCAHHPRLFDPKHALLEWTAFYTHIARCRDGFVLANFATVTGRFESVLDAVNARFDSRFDPYDPITLPESEVFRKLDETSRKRGTVRFAEPYSPFASQQSREDRAAVMRKLETDFDQLRATALGAKALRLFDHMEATADV